MTRVLCTMLNRYIVFESENPEDLYPSKIFEKLQYWIGSNANSYFIHNKEWHNSSRINLKEEFNFQQDTNSEKWIEFISLNEIPNFRDFSYFKCIYNFKIYENDFVEILHNLTKVKIDYSKIEDMDTRTKSDFWKTLDEMCVDYIDLLSCDEVFAAGRAILDNLGSNCDISSKDCEQVRDFLKYVEQLLASADLVTAPSEKLIEIYTKIGDKIGCDIVSKLIEDIENKFKDDIEEDIKDKIEEFETKPLNPPIISIPEALRDNQINAYELEDGVQVNVQFESNVKSGSTIFFEIKDSNDNITIVNHVISEKDYSDGFRSIASLNESLFNNGLYSIKAKIKSSDGRISEYSNEIIFEVNRDLISIDLNAIDNDNLIEPNYQSNDVLISGTTTNVENGAQVKIVIEDLVYYSTIVNNSFNYTAPLNDFKKLSEGFHKVIASVTNSWKISNSTEKEILIDKSSDERRIYIDSVAIDNVINYSETQTDLIITGNTINIEDGPIIIKFNTFEIQASIQDNKFESTIDSNYLQTLKDKTEYIVTATVAETETFNKVFAQKRFKTDFKIPTISFNALQIQMHHDGKLINTIIDKKLFKSNKSKDLIIEGTSTNIENNKLVSISLNNKVYTTSIINSSFKYIIPSEDIILLDGEYEISIFSKNDNDIEVTASKIFEFLSYDILEVNIINDLNGDGVLASSEIHDNIVNFEIKLDNSIPKDSEIIFEVITNTNTIKRSFKYVDDLIYSDLYEINKLDSIITVSAKIGNVISSETKYIHLEVSECEFRFRSFINEFECFSAFNNDSEIINCEAAGDISSEVPCCLDLSLINIDDFCQNFESVNFKNDSLQIIGDKLGIDFNQIVECQLSRLIARALKCKSEEISEEIKPDPEEILEEFFPKKSPVIANSSNMSEPFYLYDNLKNATEYHLLDESDPTSIEVNLSKYSMLGEGSESFIRIYFSEILLEDAIVNFKFYQLDESEFLGQEDENAQPKTGSNTIPAELIAENSSITIPAGFEHYDYYLSNNKNSTSSDKYYKVELESVTGTGYSSVTLGVSNFTFLKLVDSKNQPVLQIDDSIMIESSVLTHYVYYSEPTTQSIKYSFILEGLTAIDEVDYSSKTLSFTNGVTYNAEDKIIIVPSKTYDFSFSYNVLNNSKRDNPRYVKAYIGGESAIGTISDDGDLFKERKSYINFKEKSNYIDNTRADLNPNLWYLKIEADKSIASPGEFISFKLSIVDYKGNLYDGNWSDNLDIYAELIYVGNYTKNVNHFDLPRLVKMNNSVMEFHVEVTGQDTSPQSLMICKLANVIDRNVPISEGEIEFFKDNNKEHLPNLIKSAYDSARVVINSHNVEVPIRAVQIELLGPDYIDRGSSGTFEIKSNIAPISSALTFFIEYFYFEGASKSQITEVRLVSIPPNQTSIKFNINTLSVATAKDSVIKIKLDEPDSNSTEFDRFDFINDSKSVKLKNATNDVIVNLLGMTSVYEGNLAKYEVHISRAVRDDLTFKILLNFDETNSSDFREFPDIVTIPSGDTKGVFTVSTESDGLREESEAFQVLIHSPNLSEYTYKYSNQELTTYITDSLTTLELSVESLTVEESKTAIHKVELISESTFVMTYNSSLIFFDGVEALNYSNSMTFSNGVTYSNGIISIPETVKDFTVSYEVPNNKSKQLDSKDPKFKEQKYVLNIGGFEGVAKVIDNKETLESDKVYLNIEGPAVIYEGYFGTYTIKLSSPANSDMIFNIDYLYNTSSEIDIEVFTNQVRLFKGQSEVQFQVKVIDDEIVDDNEEFSVMIASYEGGQFEALIEQNMYVTTTIADNDFSDANNFRLIEYPFIGWFGTSESDDTFAIQGDGSEFISKDFRLDAYTTGITNELIALQENDYIETFRSAVKAHLRNNLTVLNNSKSMRAYISKYNIDKVFGFDLNDYSLEYYEVYNIFVNYNLLDDYGSLKDLINNPDFKLDNLQFYSTDRLINFFKTWDILKKIGKPGSALLYSAPSKKQLLEVLYENGVFLTFNPITDTIPEESCWRHYIIELDRPEVEEEEEDEIDPDIEIWDDFRDPRLTLARLRYYSLARLLNFITQFQVVQILQVTPPEFYLMTRFEIYQWLYTNKVVTFSYSHESQMLDPRSDVNIEPSGKETPKHIEYAMEVKILRTQFANFD